jgi:hypothetical protein
VTVEQVCPNAFSPAIVCNGRATTSPRRPGLIFVSPAATAFTASLRDVDAGWMAALEPDTLGARPGRWKPCGCSRARCCGRLLLRELLA